jgi:hypothetical protein
LSGALVGLLNACAEIPGIPGIPIEEPFGEISKEVDAGDTVRGLPDADPISCAMATGAEVSEERATAELDEEFSPAVTSVSSNPDLWMYRDRTVGLLRRYMRLSIEVGRTPSLLGREFFRTRVTSYGASTFEDSVIFVHDMERSLEELNEFERKLIAKIVLQRFSREEAGRLLGCGYRTVERLFPEALDRVSEILLERGILTGLPKRRHAVPKSCQEGKSGPFRAND